jgi:FKBP-type peptidyl-prolyl cis-trans isomerase FklB
MKNLLSFAVIAVLIVAASGCNRKVPGSGKVEMKNRIDSVSYALGYLEGTQMKSKLAETPFDTLDALNYARLFSKVGLNDEYVQWRKDQFGDFNSEIFRTAFINQIAYDKSYFNEISADVFLRMVFEAVRVEKEAASRSKPTDLDPNIDIFFAENAQREGVVALESGLQYEVLVEGSGARPSPSDMIKCHYHGTFLDGTVFDSSIDGEPASFPLNQVIAGWQEGLQMMTVGSKWKLYVPYWLAYGEEGRPGAIGPKETLIFEVELLEILD